jgi:hypothetical protein
MSRGVALSQNTGKPILRMNAVSRQPASTM